MFSMAQKDRLPLYGKQSMQSEKYSRAFPTPEDRENF